MAPGAEVFAETKSEAGKRKEVTTHQVGLVFLYPIPRGGLLSRGPNDLAEVEHR